VILEWGVSTSNMFLERGGYDREPFDQFSDQSDNWCR
jgi:hypothetical protein